MAVTEAIGEKYWEIDRPWTEVLKRFALIFTPAASLVLLLVGYLFYINLKSETETFRKDEVLTVTLGYSAVRDRLWSTAGDLLYLADTLAIPGNTDNPNFGSINKNFAVLARTKRQYSQIRLLGPGGGELARVNFDGSAASVVPTQELQAKSDRYYFREAMGLVVGEIYISKFDLNVEHGAVEKPNNPVVRIATPVKLDADGKKGVLVFNVIGNEIIDKFASATFAHRDRAMMVNADGYWMKSPNQSDEWGFMFGKKDASLASRYPASWQKMLEADQGQFEDENGLWTYRAVYPVGDERSRKVSSNGVVFHPPSYHWKVLSLVPASEMSDIFWSHAKNAILLAALACVVLIVASWSIASSYVSRRAQKTDLEQTVNRRTYELTKSNDELRRATVEADMANRAKGRFLTNMSHELRTPLNAIIGFSDVLSEEMMGPIGSAQYKFYAKDIGTSARHLVALIEDLFDVSMIDANAVNLRKEPVDLAEVIEECRRIVASTASQKGVVFKVNVVKPLPQISADRTRIRQILLNLLTNAVKFTEPRGLIGMAAYDDGMGNVCLKVKDTGVGIAENAKQRIFMPFNRGDNPQVSSREGLGLGLAISRTLVALHGGSIDIESTVGVGTTVTVILPINAVDGDVRHANIW